MLRINAINSAAGAQSYYREADYYLDGPDAETQPHKSEWHGQGAKLLGLKGPIDFLEFDRLTENRHPRTNETLTVVTRSNRRVGYDLTFTVSKSVSVVHALGGDDRIPQAMRESVHETLELIEREMMTRVRLGGKEEEDRPTGNMVWTDFLHRLSRPVDGVPDPALHVHVVAFNATHDPVENRWKAAQFGGIKASAPYFQAVFRNKMAEKLQALGYDLRVSEGDFEIRGVPLKLRKQFSGRTEQIEELAKRIGITNPDTKAILGETSREHKIDALDAAELLNRWRERISPAEDHALHQICDEARASTERGPREVERQDARYFDLALAHLLERESAVSERKLMTTALQWGIGKVSLEGLAEQLHRKDIISGRIDGVDYVTTQEAMKEEKAMIGQARSAQGRYAPLGVSGRQILDARLNADQRKAVKTILTSRDGIQLLRGIAGTGKTTLLKEAMLGIQEGGHGVTVLAPTADASRIVLRRDGIESAETLQRFLVDEKMQAAARGQVIWLDEAGLAGSRDTSKLIAIAEKLEARLVLAGDPRQHKSVARGDSLAVLEDFAGLPAIQVRDILRQSGEYKVIVSNLAAGDVAEGFKRLDDLGWIHEGKAEDIARDYIQLVSRGTETLVVSPTHAEGERITRLIREQLREMKKIEGDDKNFTRLVDVQSTEAQRSDPEIYLRNQSQGVQLVAQFERPAPGHRIGTRVAANADQVKTLTTTSHAHRLFREQEIAFAIGDAIRFTHAGQTIDRKHRIENGSNYSVAGFTKLGDIRLSNGWVVSKDFGHFAHGYTSTSHASQGKSASVVLIGMSAESFPATSREQFYVSVSRGKREARIYTDDKEALRAAVDRTDQRVSAVEVAQKTLRKERLRKTVARLRQWAKDHLIRREREIHVKESAREQAFEPPALG